MPYSLIGRISGAHGLDGRIALKHTLGKTNAFKDLKHVFIEVHKEHYIPYFLEEQKPVSEDEVLLRLDEVASPEDARSLSGKNVYIESALYHKIKPKAVTIDMVGFMLNDKEKGDLGRVEDLFETPGQVMASAHYLGKEILVPLVDATILGIDPVQKIIRLDLPHGLLDVYL